MTQTEGRLIMSKDPSKVDENGLMHSISYAAQQPWLQHASIKANILFGSPYDDERYSEAIECCALRPDLDLLDDGDLTEIGARYFSRNFPFIMSSQSIIEGCLYPEDRKQGRFVLFLYDVV